MITVHHLDDSRSQRILWLLEELGEPYEIEHHRRDPVTRAAPAALKEIHPLGKSPIIEDNGRVVSESGAIIEHILRRYGKGRLQPSVDDPQYDEYIHWMHYAEGSAMPALIASVISGDSLLASNVWPAPTPIFSKRFISSTSDGSVGQ